MNSDSMRGLFFIIKGQHRNKLSPAFVNKVTGDTCYIGGYDPYSDETEEWYQLIDRRCFHVVCCGGSLEKVLNGVRTMILKYKGSAKRYIKYVSQTTSDDYYETHYLGKSPLTPEQRSKKAEGRCPRTSPIMRCMYEEIDRCFGDFCSEEITEIEDSAYKELADSRPINKSRKLLNRSGLLKNNQVSTPNKPVLKKPEMKKMDITTKTIRPVAKKSVKLLRV